MQKERVDVERAFQLETKKKKDMTNEQQIINSISPDYLQELQDSISNSIEHLIHVILTHCFRNMNSSLKKLQQTFVEVTN